MTEADIQRRIMAERYRRSFVMPNFTPRKWWECDVFEVTEAGYFREYEIKLTLADFNADREKASTRWKIVDGHYMRDTAEVKHQLLAERSTLGPRQFWFVCPGARDGENRPHGIIPVEIIPEWAGLLVATSTRSAAPYAVYLSELKSAPILHGEKFREKELLRAKNNIYFRFMNLFLHRNGG